MQETRKQTLAVPIYCLGQSQDKIFVARLTKKKQRPAVTPQVVVEDSCVIQFLTGAPNIRDLGTGISMFERRDIENKKSQGVQA